MSNDNGILIINVGRVLDTLNKIILNWEKFPNCQNNVFL